MDPQDHAFMAEALVQARLAAAAGEVPVGAVVVKDGVVIGVGHNTPIALADPTGHAEVVALRAAATALGNYRLDGCVLYVTLEPCAMCAGAALQARLGRVVFGAAEPKTGAAGSVLNLFTQPQLNHHTVVQGGVLAHDCAALLQQFFARLRDQQQTVKVPLREDAVRTDAQRFADLPDYPWQARYHSDLVGIAGLRMHYLDEGATQAPLTFLCLHAPPGWSYFYRNLLPVWTAAGHRVVAPDLIGFGKSDKPKRAGFHALELHRNYLLDWVEKLQLNRIILVTQDRSSLLGLTLPMEAPARYAGVLVLNSTLAAAQAALQPSPHHGQRAPAPSYGRDVGRFFFGSNPQLRPQECAAYNAPFPDNGHRAALDAAGLAMSAYPEALGLELARKASDFWAHGWQGRSMEQAGLAGQEHGRALAEAALAVFEPR